MKRNTAQSEFIYKLRGPSFHLTPSLLSLVGSMMLLTANPSFADVKVTESTSTAEQRQIQQMAKQQKAQASANSQLFAEVQSLREEVMRLNGLVEEQQYHIERLKQQRLDDYVDLDKRIAAITPANSQVDTSAPVTDTAADKSGINDDKTAYDLAYNLVKERQFDEAKKSFQAFLVKYPTSSYVGNAHFWIGGISMLSGDYDEAVISYSTVIESYPAHRKVPESKYKLAEANYQLGNKNQAKLQMQQLIDEYEGRTGTDKLVGNARQFLRKHFP